jgi:hypothetical protein
MSSKNVFISIELYHKVENRAKSSGFNSVDEYITYVLEQVVEDETPDTNFTPAEEAEVKKRLKYLGYVE